MDSPPGSSTTTTTAGPDLLVYELLHVGRGNRTNVSGTPHNATTMKLYRNLGDGTFRDVTGKVGLDKVLMPMGANFGDIDNDGFLDISSAPATPRMPRCCPTCSCATRAERLRRRHGFVRDGRVAQRPRRGLRRHGQRRRRGAAWKRSVARHPATRSAPLFGTRARQRLAQRETGRSQGEPGRHRRANQGDRENDASQATGGLSHVGSGGSFGASPLHQHIGFGKRGEIVGLEIQWPASGTRQRFQDLKKNRSLEIKEFGEAYVELERRPVRLGGSGGDR